MKGKHKDRQPDTIRAEIKRWEDYLAQRLQQQVARDEELKRLRMEEEQVNKEWRARQAEFRAAGSRRFQLLQELVRRDNAAVLEKLTGLRSQLALSERVAEGSPRVQAFIKVISRGIDWSGRWVCVWEQGDFCILTKRTGSVFAGIGCRAVAPALHGLYDLRRLDQPADHGGIAVGQALERKCCLAKQEGGRLTPTMKQEWIKVAERSA